MITQLLYPSIKPIAWFHAYVACGVIGLRWGKFTSTSTYNSPALREVFVEYLDYACGEDEWTKGRIIEAARGLTATKIKQAARVKFPSLFPRNKRARPFGVPDELEGQEVKFDPDKIEAWKERVKAIKQEISMNENALVQEADTTGDSTKSDSAKSNSRVTVNFYIPQGVDVDSLTLENYLSITHKRYRMTREQKERVEKGEITREQAFAESKDLAVKQLGEK